ncbi:DUF6221 family protein [Micromonospora tulbaghiae]|uniref:DUF6221 family protein n=1 Tax=Micromonospora tulbaghiae TaxID=479978 RepID=UPI0033A6B0C2
MDELIPWLHDQMSAQRLRADSLKAIAAALPHETGAYLVETADLLLAEVDAKRRILERHVSEEHFLHGTICTWCSVPQGGAYQSWPCPDIRDSASPYADMPGYQERWRLP